MACTRTLDACILPHTAGSVEACPVAPFTDCLVACTYELAIKRNGVFFRIFCSVSFDSYLACQVEGQEESRARMGSMHLMQVVPSTDQMDDSAGSGLPRWASATAIRYFPNYDGLLPQCW